MHINDDKVFKKLKRDIDRWKTLPASLQSRVSMVKMNTLPRVNFLSAMIPLPPLLKWWKRLDSLICTFLWNGKQPKLKLSTLQHTKMEGGLSLPNFELYHKAFQLRAVKTWFDPMISTPSREIEEIVKPIRLGDVLFSGTYRLLCGVIGTLNVILNHSQQNSGRSRKYGLLLTYGMIMVCLAFKI